MISLASILIAVDQIEKGARVIIHNVISGWLETVNQSDDRDYCAKQGLEASRLDYNLNRATVSFMFQVGGYGVHSTRTYLRKSCDNKRPAPDLPSEGKWRKKQPN